MYSNSLAHGAQGRIQDACLLCSSLDYNQNNLYCNLGSKNIKVLLHQGALGRSLERQPCMKKKQQKYWEMHKLRTSPVSKKSVCCITCK